MSAQGRWGARMGDVPLLDSMLLDGLNDAFSGQHSGWHTEDLVNQYGISRADQDAWALRSQLNFSQPRRPASLQRKSSQSKSRAAKGQNCLARMNTTDRKPRRTPWPSSTAFRKEGTITAGNAPGLNSGAAAMIVADCFCRGQWLAADGKVGRLRRRCR